MTACTTIPIVIVHHDPFVRAHMATALGELTEFAVRAVLPALATPADALTSAHGGLIVSDLPTAVLLFNTVVDRHACSPAEPRLAVVSSCDREWELRRALSARVHGYLSAGFDTAQLLDCVFALRAGGRYLCPRTAARLAESLSFDALTERETAVIRLVVKGLPNKSIGRQLGISLGTVKSHLKSAYAKLEVTSRTQAIGETQRRGLLPLEIEAAVTRPRTWTARPHALASTLRLARGHAISGHESRTGKEPRCMT